MSDNPGREAFMRSMRKVLVRRGFTGDALEAKIAELLETPRYIGIMKVLDRGSEKPVDTNPEPQYK